MTKFIVTIAVLLLIVIGWDEVRERLWAFQTPAQAVYRQGCKDVAGIHAGEVEQVVGNMVEVIREHGFSPGYFRDTMVGQAIITNKGRATCEEVRLTADGKTIGFAPNFVRGWVSTPQGHIEFRGPLQITATGYIETDSGAGGYRSGPDGIMKNSRLSLFPLPIDDDSIYNALIGRVCDDVGCTDWFFNGSARVLCPDQIGKTGWVELSVNQHKELFNNNRGGYEYDYKPAPTAACE